MEDNDFRDLQERTALVAEMAAHPGWTLLIDRARVTMAARQRRLILGKAKDYEDYRCECAWMDGVSWLTDLPSQIALELENEVADRAEREQAEDDAE